MEIFITLGSAVIGCSAIVYGVSRWSGPAAWVTFGTCCLLVALWPFLRSRWFETL